MNVHHVLLDSTNRNRTLYPYPTNFSIPATSIRATGAPINPTTYWVELIDLAVPRINTTFTQYPYLVVEVYSRDNAVYRTRLTTDVSNISQSSYIVPVNDPATNNGFHHLSSPHGVYMNVKFDDAWYLTIRTPANGAIAISDSGDSADATLQVSALLRFTLPQPHEKHS